MLASASTNATTKTIDRQRRAVAEAQILEQRAERVERDRLGGGARAAAGQDVHQVEDAERVERAEEKRDQQRRPEQRQRDVDELPPAARRRRLGRLVERLVDVLQAGEQQERDERRRLPDVGQDERHPRGDGGRRTTSAALDPDAGEQPR